MAKTLSVTSSFQWHDSCIHFMITKLLCLQTVTSLGHYKGSWGKAHLMLLHRLTVAKWKRKQRQSCLPYLGTGNEDFHRELVLQSYLGRFLWGSGQNEAQFLLEMHLLLLSAIKRKLSQFLTDWIKAYDRPCRHFAYIWKYTIELKFKIRYLIC